MIAAVSGCGDDDNSDQLQSMEIQSMEIQSTEIQSKESSYDLTDEDLALNNDTSVVALIPVQINGYPAREAKVALSKKKDIQKNIVDVINLYEVSDPLKTTAMFMFEYRGETWYYIYNMLSQSLFADIYDINGNKSPTNDNESGGFVANLMELLSKSINWRLVYCTDIKQYIVKKSSEH